MIGMGLADFDTLHPSEFRAVVDAWRHHEEECYSRTLAAIRVHATCCVQPHVKKRLMPRDLWQIPAVDEDPELNAGHEQLSKEEKKARFEQLKKQRGYE